MNVPFVDLRVQFDELENEIRAAIDSVLYSSAFSGDTAFVSEFERRFAEFCGTKHCIAVSSGTAALEVLLRAYGLTTGDEVILPVNTFVAAAEAIMIVGATPVFIDVNDETAHLDVRRLETVITPRTRCIMPVHLFGQPVDMKPILSLSQRHDLVVIEDSSQAHGALYHGKRAGSLGHSGSFSFYPSKNLGACGEGGGITTDDDDIAQKCRLLRNHGARDKHHHDIVGRNDRMDGIQAAILSAKLPMLDKWNQQRRVAAERFRVGLRGNSRIRFFTANHESVPVHHLFVVRIPNRDQVRAALENEGVMSGIHYPIPLHLQVAFQDLGYREGDFPVAEMLAQEMLSLPMYPGLKPDQVDFVVELLMRLV